MGKKEKAETYADALFGKQATASHAASFLRDLRSPHPSSYWQIRGACPRYRRSQRVAVCGYVRCEWVAWLVILSLRKFRN